MADIRWQDKPLATDLAGVDIIPGTQNPSPSAPDCHYTLAQLASFFSDNEVYTPVTVAAHIGGGQAGATLITDPYSILTVDNPNDSVKIDTSVIGKQMIVVNTDNNAANVYPLEGANFLGYATDAPILLNPFGFIIFIPNSATNISFGACNPPKLTTVNVVPKYSDTHGNLQTTGVIIDSGNNLSATNLSGTNTGDQLLFSQIVVSGQVPVVANTKTTSLTFVSGDNVTITNDNTAKAVTINSGGLRQVNSSGSKTFTITDKNTFQYLGSTGSDITCTVPKDSSVGFPVGTSIYLLNPFNVTVHIVPIDGTVTIYNASAPGSTIKQPTDLTYQYQQAELQKIDTDIWAFRLIENTFVKSDDVPSTSFSGGYVTFARTRLRNTVQLSIQTNGGTLTALSSGLTYITPGGFVSLNAGYWPITTTQNQYIYIDVNAIRIVARVEINTNNITIYNGINSETFNSGDTLTILPTTIPYYIE